MKKIALLFMAICLITIASCTTNKNGVRIFYTSNEGALDGENKVLSNIEYFYDYYEKRSFQDSTAPRTYSSTYLGIKLSGTYKKTTQTNELTYHSYRGERIEDFEVDRDGNITLYFTHIDNIAPLDVDKRDEAYEFALGYCKELYPTCFDLFELEYEEQRYGAFRFCFRIMCGDVKIGAVTIGTNQEGEISLVDDRNRKNIEWFLNNSTTDFSKFIDKADKSIKEKFAENSDYTIENESYALYLENGKTPCLRSVYVVEGKDIFVLVPIKK